MKIGDKVFVHRKGPLPHWFKWQGLPCTIIAIEAHVDEITCHMPDGNNVSFYARELEYEWSGLSGSSVSEQPDYPSQAPQTIASIQDPNKPPGGTSRGERASRYDVSCPTCAHAAEHKWFGLPTGTHHCRNCHATWTGYSVIHCVMCHRTFGSPAALKRHKGAGDVCRDPRAVKARTGQSYFTEPTINQFGTEIWRQSGEGRPTFDKED